MLLINQYNFPPNCIRAKLLDCFILFHALATQTHIGLGQPTLNHSLNVLQHIIAPLYTIWITARKHASDAFSGYSSSVVFRSSFTALDKLDECILQLWKCLFEA